MKKLNKAKIIKIIAFVILIVIIVSLTVYMMPIINKLNTTEGQIKFKNEIEQTGITGVLTLFELYFAQILLAFLPGEPIEILAGICFGPVWGTILLMTAVLITTSIIYFLVKKYGRDFIYEFFPKNKVNKIENSKLFQDERTLKIILAILFLIPGTPKDLLTYIGGLLPIKSSTFIIMATLFRFPSIISSTILGENMLNGNWKIGILAYILTIIISIIIVIIYTKIDKSDATKKIIHSIKNKDI